MTRNEAKQVLANLPLVRAWVDGKTLQSNIQGNWIDWIVDTVPLIDADAWRIKPEPRTWWIIVDTGLCFPTRKLAENYLSAEHLVGYEIVEACEVLK